MNIITYRSLIHMFIMTFITCGFYLLYWNVTTKNDLNRLGAEIPTAWLMIIPLANFYFWYKYAQAFAYYIKQSDQAETTIVYFVIIIFLPVISKFILQNDFNAYAKSKA